VQQIQIYTQLRHLSPSSKIHSITKLYVNVSVDAMHSRAWMCIHYMHTFLSFTVRLQYFSVFIELFLPSYFLWPPKARPLYFTVVIFFYFVSIDETPAMGSQPNLPSRSEVVSIYKCPQKFRGPPPKFGEQKNIKFWTTLSATSALDTTYLRNETSHGQTKIRVSINNVSPTS